MTSFNLDASLWFFHFSPSEIPCFQLISGLYSCSQGKPRIIFCFPNPITSKQRFICSPLICAFNSTKDVIVPFLFFVPSTFRAHRGLSSFLISKPCFPCIVLVDKLSSCSTIQKSKGFDSFFTLIFIKMGTDIEFDIIFVMFTE